MRLAIGFFFLRENRMPTPQEVKALTRESFGDKGLLWERYGKNRFGQESYYHYGYEKGECTFFVDPSNDPSDLNESFRKYLLPAISHALTELEHQWIIYDIQEMPPNLLVLSPAVSSSICLELLDIMRSPTYRDRREEIRNELIKEKEEGTYERICVFSKPFQEKLARRKIESGTQPATDAATRK
jgi:hypothetical protein